MREIFNSHPVSVLKKEISKTNIKGYSKMKKGQIVDLMMKNKERFKHIKMAEKKAPAPAKKPTTPPPKKKKIKLNVLPKTPPKKAPPKAKKVKLNVLPKTPPKAKTPSPPKKQKLDFKVINKGVRKKLDEVYGDLNDVTDSISESDRLIKGLVRRIMMENKFNNNDEAIKFINSLSTSHLFKSARDETTPLNQPRSPPGGAKTPSPPKQVAKPVKVPKRTLAYLQDIAPGDLNQLIWERVEENIGTDAMYSKQGDKDRFFELRMAYIELRRLMAESKPPIKRPSKDTERDIWAKVWERTI